MDRRQFLAATAVIGILPSASRATQPESALDAPGKLYKVVVPANMPVKRLWSLTIYDHATFSFVYTESKRTTLSAYDLAKMTKNADESVTLYVGPNAAAALEANWIASRGKRPTPTFRFYGATDAMNQKTFKMQDFEEVNA